MWSLQNLVSYFPLVYESTLMKVQKGSENSDDVILTQYFSITWFLKYSKIERLDQIGTITSRKEIDRLLGLMN